MGMLGPLVLGALGQKQRSSGLDANGLVDMLASQKESIARALPAGFAKEIQGTGLLGSIASALPKAAPGVSVTAPASPPLPSLWPWLAGLAALALLLWLITGSPKAPDLAQLPQADVTTAAGATKHVQSLSERLQMVLGSVSDEASAKAAVPRISDITAELERVRSATANLPAAERSGVATAISALLQAIAPKIDEILKIPGVGPILKPVVDAAVAKLQEFARA
jgi:hypothetical protein